MTDIYLRRFNTPAASAATGGELESAEIDANFTKIHPTLRALLDGAAANFNNNARTKGLMPAPPTVTVGTATVPSGFTRSFVFGDTGAPFVSGGGTPTTASGVTTFPVCTVAGTTKEVVSWRVETILDGDEIAFLLSSATANGYRFLVDGQYVSMTGTVSAAGADRYYTLTFPTRDRRRITVEGQVGLAFAQARVKFMDTLIKPPALPMVYMVGDSNHTASGEAYDGDGLVPVLGDHFGLIDVRAGGAFGTGFVATDSGTKNKYADRRTDWTGASPDMVIFWLSVNDYLVGPTTAAYKTAIALELTQARSALGKHVPIIVMAESLTSTEYYNSISALATVQGYETAAQEAVDDQADPLMRFVPNQLLTGPKPIHGLSGSDSNFFAIYNNGTNHLNAEGYKYYGKWTAYRLLETIADMAGVEVPLLAPAAPPTSVVLSTGPADSWTYVKLASDFSTTGTANADTSMLFTPDINSQYEVEGYFYLQGAATTTGPRPGIKWSTAGITRNIARIGASSSATALVQRFWGSTTAANAANTAVTAANVDQWGDLQAFFNTGGTVTGAFTVTLASEVSGSAARMMTGSFIRYRKI